MSLDNIYKKSWRILEGLSPMIRRGGALHEPASLHAPVLSKNAAEISCFVRGAPQILE